MVHQIGRRKDDHPVILRDGDRTWSFYAESPDVKITFTIGSLQKAYQRKMVILTREFLVQSRMW
jgi:hypothetical protein